MKQRWLIYAAMFCLVLFFVGAGVGAGFDVGQEARAEDGPASVHPSSLFSKGVRAYEDGEYAAAAKLFEQVAESGVVNGELFYDAGNAWFKAGDTGRAVLWYKRAERLMPANPDVAFNLGLAEKQVRDQQADSGYLEQGLRRWTGLWSPGVAAWIAVGMNVLFWLLCAAKRTGRPAFMEWKGAWVRGVRNFLLVGTLVFAVTAGWWYCRSVCFPQGVVLDETVSARSGLGELATKLFTLHAGTVVDIERSRDGHVLIRHGVDHVGWVSEKKIGRI